MSGARAWLLGLFVCLLAHTASAEVTRYAVVIGNDRGSTGEAPLRFAEADARKVFAVLKELGRFRAENAILLEGRGAAEVQRVLISVNARIRAETHPGQDAVLFVYYSGHADAEALHLGDEPLELSLLQRLVQGSSASFRLLVLDACRSGALTRVKGGHAVPAFAVTLQAPLDSEGIAFLTSSAEDEDAQESDALKGSFFTHYLVSGLRGAADRNQNGDVSLEEVYTYAYQHTLRASSQTLYGMQHPTFRLDLKGRGAVPLTWLSQRGQGASVSLPAGHAFLLFVGDAGGPVAAEVGQYDMARTLALEAGRYFVRGRARDHLLEGVVEIAPGQDYRLRDSELERVEYARLARKGGSERLRAHGPWLGYQLRTPFWSDASYCHGLRGGYALDLAELSLSLALSVCRSRFESSMLRARADETSLDLSAARVLDLPVVSLSFGGTVGVGWLHQSFETRGRAPARDSWVLSPGLLMALSAEIGQGFYAFSEALGRLSIFRQRRANDSEETSAVPALQLTLGAGTRF